MTSLWYTQFNTPFKNVIVLKNLFSPFSDGYQLPRNHLQKVINGTLTIEKVQKYQDVGMYTCTARNGDGQGNSSSVHVAVLGILFG